MIKKNFYKKNSYEPLLAILIVAGFFVLVSYLTQSHLETIRSLVLRGGELSIVVYILITILAIIAAPLTSIPLIPLVVQIWGVFLTSVLSIIGWTIGSLGAFWIARTFGVTVVKKIEPLDRLRAIALGVPKKKIFWYLLFLRMTIPVDILSYALGLFTGISWKMFLITTFLGIIPVTFLLSYVGSLPIELQLPLIISGVVLIIAFFAFHSRKMKS